MFKNGQCFTEFNLTKAVYERFDDASYICTLITLDVAQACTGIVKFKKKICIHVAKNEFFL